MSEDSGLAVDLVATDEYQAFCRSELTEPYSLLDELRRRDPVHWSPLLESWVVTSYTDAIAALREARLCNDRVAAQRPCPARSDPADIHLVDSAPVELARVHGPAQAHPTTRGLARS